MLIIITMMILIIITMTVITLLTIILITDVRSGEEGLQGARPARLLARSDHIISYVIIIL